MMISPPGYGVTYCHFGYTVTMVAVSLASIGVFAVALPRRVGVV
jgi:hypothetical protein